MWSVDPPHFLENETFVHKGDCTYGSGISLWGGAAFLTNKRIIFKTRASLLGNEEISIFLDQISEIKVSKTPIQIPNGFILMDKSGKKHRFICQKRKQWMELIQQQMDVL
jgi:hypothetical protein